MKRKIPFTREELVSKGKRQRVEPVQTPVDIHWLILGGYPDYRPYALRMMAPLNLPKVRNMKPKVVKLLSALSRKRKIVEARMKSKKKPKKEELLKLEEEMHKECEKNREFEHSLRQKLKT